MADCTQQLAIIKQESKACGQRLKQAEAALSQLRDGLQPCYPKWLEAQREHNRVSLETQESKQHQATESAALEVLAQQETPLNKEIAQLRQRREGLEESLKRLKNARKDIEKSLENQRERIGQLQEQQGMAARLCASAALHHGAKRPVHRRTIICMKLRSDSQILLRGSDTFNAPL